MLDTGGGGRPVSGAGPAVAPGKLTLHMGMLVQPYGGASAKTTADVARILEEKYGIMHAFFRVRGEDVSEAIELSVSNALEALLMGQAVDPWARGMNIIERAFREFILLREVEKAGIPGVPTQAALRGVNHRLRHPYAGSNARRPSFRDTGLYTNSFKAWVT